MLPGFKGPHRRLGPAGQSRKAAPGHRKRRIQPASPRHSTGTTLRGSGRGRRAGGMRRGHALAWGKRDGEGSGNHRTCPSPELGPRGQTYPCSHRPFTPAGDRAPEPPLCAHKPGTRVWPVHLGHWLQMSSSSIR